MECSPERVKVCTEAAGRNSDIYLELILFVGDQVIWLQCVCLLLAWRAAATPTDALLHGLLGREHFRLWYGSSVDCKSLCYTLLLLRVARGHRSLSWHDSKSTCQAYFPCTTSHAFLPTLTQWWLSADVFQVGHLQKMILLFWSNPSLPWRHSQRRPVSSSPGLYACVFWGGIKRGGKDCHISARSPQLQTTFRTLLWFSKTR